MHDYAAYCLTPDRRCQPCVPTLRVPNPPGGKPALATAALLGHATACAGTPEAAAQRAIPRHSIAPGRSSTTSHGPTCDATGRPGRDLSENTRHGPQDGTNRLVRSTPSAGPALRRRADVTDEPGSIFTAHPRTKLQPSGRGAIEHAGTLLGWLNHPVRPPLPLRPCRRRAGTLPEPRPARIATSPPVENRSGPPRPRIQIPEQVGIPRRGRWLESRLLPFPRCGAGAGGIVRAG
jgi:hypothetical protein